MFRSIVDFLRRWTGFYPVSSHIEGVKEHEQPSEAMQVGEGHVRLPDGTWFHGGPHGGGHGGGGV